MENISATLSLEGGCVPVSHSIFLPGNMGYIRHLESCGSMWCVFISCLHVSSLLISLTYPVPMSAQIRGIALREFVWSNVIWDTTRQSLIYRPGNVSRVSWLKRWSPTLALNRPTPEAVPERWNHKCFHVCCYSPIANERSHYQLLYYLGMCIISQWGGITADIYTRMSRLWAHISWICQIARRYHFLHPSMSFLIKFYRVRR